MGKYTQKETIPNSENKETTVLSLIKDDSATSPWSVILYVFQVDDEGNESYTFVTISFAKLIEQSRSCDNLDVEWFQPGT